MNRFPLAAKSTLTALLTLTLCACASSKPPETEPVRHNEAQRLAKAAARATLERHWAAAALLWRETAQRYGALDNWQEAGYARLGEAQALAKSDRQQALALLRQLADTAFYPAPVRAEAHYQQALLAFGDSDWTAGSAALDRAQTLCAAPCALSGALANARARAAAGQGQWAEAQAFAETALKIADLDEGERANAMRRQGEALLRLGRPEAARPLLDAALDIDRRLGRPAAIVAGLALRAEAAESGDAAVWQARARQACADAGEVDCPGGKKN